MEKLYIVLRDVGGAILAEQAHFSDANFSVNVGIIARHIIIRDKRTRQKIEARNRGLLIKKKLARKRAWKKLSRKKK